MLACRAASERNARGRPGRRLRDASRRRRRWRTGSEAAASSSGRRSNRPSFLASLLPCVPRGKNLAKQSTYSVPAPPLTVKSRTRMPQVERAGGAAGEPTQDDDDDFGEKRKVADGRREQRRVGNVKAGNIGKMRERNFPGRVIPSASSSITQWWASCNLVTFNVSNSGGGMDGWTWLRPNNSGEGKAGKEAEAEAERRRPSETLSLCET